VYYTHHFASQETLDRAHSWLLELGFPPSSIEVHALGIPRISVAVEPARFSEVELLISAVERSDPRGWPGLWDVANQVQVSPPLVEAADVSRPRTSATTAIGWHPVDAPSAAAPDREAVSEAMVRKWGWA